MQQGGKRRFGCEKFLVRTPDFIFLNIARREFKRNTCLMSQNCGEDFM